jgi:hypothetical protein
MESLALKVSTPESIEVEGRAQPQEPNTGEQEKTLKTLLTNEEYSAAFFLARRLVTSGDQWAETYLEQAQSHLTDSAN